MSCTNYILNLLSDPLGFPISTFPLNLVSHCNVRVVTVLFFLCSIVFFSHHVILGFLSVLAIFFDLYMYFRKITLHLSLPFFCLLRLAMLM